ncbi:MAG: hypothetical protein KY452_13585 [Actinobacteria bacterium]|nr:hypothetical protein [Actinomycetota bacterium]
MDGFPVVAIVGGGQLARMCQPPAVAMSVTLSVLAEREDESAVLVVPDSRLGAPDDLDAIRRLAAGADVLVHEVFDDVALGQRDEDERDDWEAGQREHHLRTSHTPLSRVGEVAAAAGVGRLVLTHFIPGDDALPDDVWVKGAGAGFDGEVVVGHDLLELAL